MRPEMRMAAGAPDSPGQKERADRDGDRDRDSERDRERERERERRWEEVRDPRRKVTGGTKGGDYRRKEVKERDANEKEASRARA